MAISQVLKGYSTLVGGLTSAVGLITEFDEEISAAQMWYGFGQIQEQILYAADKLDVSDFSTEEEYIEAYRSLAYTYLLCCIKANEGFEGLKGYDQDLYESVQASICQILYDIATVSIEEVGSRASITNYAFPNIISVGDPFVSYGQIEAKQPLQKVEVIIRDTSSGNEVCHAHSGPLDPACTYNIVDLDDQLTYNALGPSVYAVETYANGILIYETTFVVQPEDHVFIVDGYRLPYPQPEKQSFSVNGYVKSQNELKSVYVAIENSNGKKYGKPYSASGHYFDLKSADNDLLFDRLGVGNYWFVVEATDICGNTEILINQPFYVY